MSSSSSSDSEQSTARTRKTTVEKLRNDNDSDSESSDSEPSDDDASDDAQSVANGAEEEDVPVLSHAEKRRQKRKEQKQKTELTASGDAAPTTKKKTDKIKNTAELAPSKQPKRQNSVWVGNLSFKTTPESLRTFFDGVGEITRIHMPTKLASAGPGGRGAVKENRGFAYVDFSTPDAKVVAITLSEGHLDGRRLLIKDGDDFNGRPAPSADAAADGSTTDPSKPALSGHTKTAQKILRSQKQLAGPTLFLGNLGFATTKESIREMLQSHRKMAEGEAEAESKELEDGAETKGKRGSWILNVRIGTFEDSGKCKGWAFVDFTSTEYATAALTNPKNHFLDGRKLVVEYASPEAVRRGQEAAGIYINKGQSRTTDGGKQKRKKVDEEGGADGTHDEPAQAQKPWKKRKTDGEAPVRGAKDARDSRREGRPPKARPRPGAALALAKRETVAIVPSEGKKIVF